MRVRSTLPLLALALLAACAPKEARTLPGDPLPVERFAEEGRSLTLHGAIEESRRLVVRDSETLRETWADIGQRRDAPAVDFDRETVVVAAMGMRPTGGYAIIIDGASLHADTVHVLVRSIAPGADCMVTQVITHPADAARIPLAGLPVRFVERSETTPCR
jgi:hypothetical protein